MPLLTIMLGAGYGSGVIYVQEHNPCGASSSLCTFKEQPQTTLGGYGRLGWRCNQYVTEVEMPKDVAGMATRTPTPCSCFMCGNPRHQSWENPLTVQERKAEETYKYEIDELDF